MTTNSTDQLDGMNPLQSLVDGTPFSVILSRAVKLKSLQMAEFRSTYDSYPEFYRNTIFSQDDIIHIRTKSFQTQIDYANTLNDEGRDAFKRNEFLQAYAKYELSLSVFRYLHNKNSNWKNEGIKDIDIEEVVYESKNEDEMNAVCSVCLKCYTNIAATALKIERYTVALEACTLALVMDPQNVKALFLRSKARTIPKYSGISDLKLALQDLDKALSINPGNETIRHEVMKLKLEINQNQIAYQKMFKGMFARTEVLPHNDYQLVQRETVKRQGVVDYQMEEIERSHATGVTILSKSLFKLLMYRFRQVIPELAQSQRKPSYSALLLFIALLCGALYMLDYNFALFQYHGNF